MNAVPSTCPEDRLDGASVNREIWNLLWPVLLLNLAQKLGSVFEGLLVSVNSAAELTVTGLCGPYISLMTTVSYGLGIAINVAVGKAVRQGVWQSCRRRAQGLLLVLLLACSGVVSLVTLAALLPAFSGAPELRSLGMAYMLPYLMGSPILLLFSVLIAVMRGLGDTKAGMWMTFLSTPLQLVISWKCYTTFGLGALGYGMLLSRGVGCGLGLWRYRRKCAGRSGDGRLPKGFVREFWRLAIPVSLSKAISPMAGALVNGFLLSVGSVYVGAGGLGGRLEAFFYLPAMSMGTVAVIMVARCEQTDRLKPLCLRLCLWALLPTLAVSIAAGCLMRPVWGLMTMDAALARAGVLYWSICLWAYPCIALEMTVGSVLQALGCGMPTLAITIVRLWGVQLPAAWLSVRLGWGAAGIWGGFLASNVISLCVISCWAWYQLNRRDKHREVGKG